MLSHQFCLTLLDLKEMLEKKVIMFMRKRLRKNMKF